MPTIKIIDSIKIDVYSRDHPPPHFHAIYAEYEELIVIESLEALAGYMPHAQRRKVLQWARNNKRLLLDNYNRLNPRE
jgi:hypothetical protein